MKQMISCMEKCAKRPIPKFPGEYYKRIFGTAKRNMECDFCGAPIAAGDSCAAETIGKINMGQPYHRWEHELIDIAPGQEIRQPFENPVVVEVTVRQKEGVTHTKFMLIDGLHPFPRSNFEMAQQWREQGLLDDKVAELVRVMTEGTPVIFR
jgi:hypothetical protein